MGRGMCKSACMEVTMELQQFEVNINPTDVHSISAFSNMFGRNMNFKKTVYFIRYIGFDNQEKYLDEIKQMDQFLYKRSDATGAGYIRINELEHRLTSEQISYYTIMYDDWDEIPDMEEERKLSYPLSFRFQHDRWEAAFKNAFQTVLTLYQKENSRWNFSIGKNFAVKLLHWIHVYFPKLFLETKTLSIFPKFVFYGNLKTQEYLFLHMIAMLGCDVLYLNPLQDVELKSETYENLSFLTGGKQRGEIFIPTVDVTSMSNEPKPVMQKIILNQESPRLIIPPRPVRKNQGQAKQIQTKQIQVLQSQGKQPLEYEELAKVASSIVMIQVLDQNKKCFKTGSGVVINDEGYILTNFHVACEGTYYGIRLEQENEIFYADKLIKYNQLYDLAILKMDRYCKRVPVYQGEKELVRGQKVVAIGSPLGLFNTVSDGIISGFRKLGDNSMIQFTAPISNGSSGGALLDLYGNLIGIITAGFDDGQNLNLAVEHKTIQMFIRGFI